MREYKLVHSQRKSILLRINEDASLELRAPLNVSKKEADDFVKSKEPWIKKHICRIKEQHDIRKQFKLNFGDSVLLKGEPVAIHPMKENFAKFENGRFLIHEGSDSKQIKYLVVELYKSIAKAHITERVILFKEKLKVEPTAVRITSAKTRWGSCSGKNSVNFTWKLIMGDDEVIDYVVVHELAHIMQHNHSPKFWKVVESVLPDYKKRKKKLKDLEKRLSVENWD